VALTVLAQDDTDAALGRLGDLTALPSRSVDRRAEDFMVMNQKNSGSGLIEKLSGGWINK
jgi:hypothetical protein